MILKESMLRWMNDLSVQGIFVTDEKFTVLAWNHWLEEYSGRGAASIVGFGLFEAYPDLIERGLARYYEGALAGQVAVLSHRLHGYLLAMPPQAIESSYARMRQSARIAPLLEGDRVIGTVTVIDDVTERAEYEEQLVRLLAREQAARKEAEAANRAKDEFLATVSHELRTPLNAISGWVQILRKGNLDPEFVRYGLETVERNVQVQTRIIEDILDVSRVIRGKLSLQVEAVDLVPVILAALDAVRLAADARSIRLQAEVENQEVLVSGDPNRLQQVVWNLVSNAIKFTPPGGNVTVRLEQTDSQAEISVADSGKGISAEFLPFVFDRFRQADSTSTRSHGGLGLGLAIVRHLVEMHGGTVHADSPGEGQGAIFTVSLPLLIGRDLRIPEVSQSEHLSGADPSSEDEGDLAPGYASRLRGLRVLVVDDEADARDMLQIMLTQFGADVKVTGSTSEALKMVECWRPEVLVSDIGMPDEDGYTLIQKIRVLAPEGGGRIPAVALTGYAGPEDRRRLISAGYQAHLPKPVQLYDLLNTIASLTG
jgi:signal transduction histidine kinase